MKQRLISLDVLRGLTMILMTIVNNPGDWGHVYPPLLHAEWHGCTPTDLVFPTFLLIVGISIVLATPAKNLNGPTLQKIVTRTLRIFCLGMFSGFFVRLHLFGLEGNALLAARLVVTAMVVVALFSDYDRKWQFITAAGIFAIMIGLAFSGIEPFNTVRIPGVLQRIAVVYLIASLLYLKTSWRTQAIVGAVLLLGYWAVMTLISVPGTGGATLEKGTNLAAWLDNLLLPGHLWASSKTWDPEGILSTLPAIGTGIAGLLIGTLLKSEGLGKSEKVKYMLTGGLAAVAAGWLWSLVFPLNKALWTSSFVLYAGGWALLCLAVLYYIIDLKGHSKWTAFFVAWGVNPMVVFFFTGMIFRLLNAVKVENPVNMSEKTDLVPYFYQYRLAPLFTDPRDASLAQALLLVALWSLILLALYRKKLVFKV
ncbi:membrane protein [Dyadobacter beijingensis]|uniref:Membrane protein n=1 Tax=Dyadobacter beijingensis TaxID=365489 RepID=A0ABQ2HE99_9BACT|nr:heparan-alpha-glucosaminide N-acetyltransferase domain-containing protein [Dyadobacter beijingensis]GGM75052.1 membrane protein [Dyadobacter beijingensis]